MESPATIIRQVKEIKGTQTGKEEIKLSLYTNDIVIYVENAKESTGKGGGQGVLELKHEFSLSTKYKICFTFCLELEFIINQGEGLRQLVQSWLFPGICPIFGSLSPW